MKHNTLTHAEPHQLQNNMWVWLHCLRQNHLFHNSKAFLERKGKLEGYSSSAAYFINVSSYYQTT